MIKYKVIKNSVETNSWLSSFADENYYEPGFGKLERWVREEDEDVSNALETREVEDETLGTVTEYRLPAEFTIEVEDLEDSMEWDALRMQRNNLLKESDWTQLSDSPLATEDKAAWAVYRQSLRDLPDNTEDPSSPDWPSQP